MYDLSEYEDGWKGELLAEMIPKLAHQNFCDTLSYMGMAGLITIYNGTNAFLKENRIAFSTENARSNCLANLMMLKNIIAFKIFSLPEIWLIVDNYTQCPFLDKRGSAWIFMDESRALDCISNYFDQLKDWHAEKIEQEDIKETLSELFYVYGALGCLLDEGGEELGWPAGLFLAQEKKPAEIILNPSLMRALIMYKEDAGKTDEVANTRINTLVHELKKAIFIVPFKAKYALPKGNNVNYIKNIFTYPLVSGILHVPIFTDMKNLSWFCNKDDWMLFAMSLEQIRNFFKDKDVIINPATIGFTLSKELINKILYRKDS